MTLVPIRGAISVAAGYSAPYSDAIAAANQLHADVSNLWNAAVLSGALNGTGDVMVATVVPVPPAYVDGLSFWITPPGNNSVEPTIDLGPGVKTIKNRKGGALAAGSTVSTGRYLITYVAASGHFRVMVNEAELTALVAPLPLDYLAGFGTANNVSDANNDIDIALGAARDSTNAANLVGAAMTKQMDAVWAAGTNHGAVLQSANLAGTITITTNTAVAGSGTAFLTDFAVGDVITSAGGQSRRITVIPSNIAMTVESAWGSGETGVTYKRGGKAKNTLYRLHAIYKTGDPVDYAMSTRDIPVDLPTGYTLFRHIWHFRTDSSANNIAYLQDDDEFLLLTALTDGTTGYVNTSSTTITSLAPPNSTADLVIDAPMSGAGATFGKTWLRNPLQAVRTPSTAPDTNVDNAGFNTEAARRRVKLNSSAQYVIDVQDNNAGTSGVTAITYLRGWTWRRGRG